MYSIGKVEVKQNVRALVTKNSITKVDGQVSP